MDYDDEGDILLSVHPRHVDNMVSGIKTVELCRRCGLIVNPSPSDR